MYTPSGRRVYIAYLKAIYIYRDIYTHTGDSAAAQLLVHSHTRWQKLLGSPRLQIISTKEPLNIVHFCGK